MKQLLILACLITLSFKPILAQYNYGIKGGLNLTNNVVNQQSTINDSKYKPGIHFGFFASADVTENIDLQAELLYSGKGYRFVETAFSESGNLRLNYLNLPLLVGYKATDVIRLSIGPEMGYLISATTKFGSDKIDVGDKWDNKFDIGIAAGLDYTLNEKIFTGIRYSHGLTSVIRNAYISDNNGNSTGERAKFQNRTLQLTLGYLLK
ncbi:porin family protein [Fulvivirga lutimaris]|uniref:porin family protein n=1 Tax=Fulvivirga lutimaris TaxID=1819566 RepID=UPI001C87F6FC|nr:porin family protein [Fulvivirga lutimaris]